LAGAISKSSLDTLLVTAPGVLSRISCTAPCISGCRDSLLDLNNSLTTETVAGDYAFEPVNPEMKKGDDVTLAVRLTTS